MASMRKLRLRLRRWERYADRVDGQIGGRPAHNGRERSGYWRAFIAVQREHYRREFADYVLVCDACGLPDPYRGEGDGVGSCDCPRCDCGSARWSSLCSCPLDDWNDEYEYEDDEPTMRVDTVLAFQEAGLL